MVDWLLLPQQQRSDWREAARCLAAAAKPLLVVPLLEPGCLAISSFDELAPEMKRTLQHELGNQRGFLMERLDAMCLAEPGFVETPDGILRISISDLHRWADEYCLQSVGLGIAKSAPDSARILVRRPGGGREPVGWIPPTR